MRSKFEASVIYAEGRWGTVCAALRLALFAAGVACEFWLRRPGLGFILMGIVLLSCIEFSADAEWDYDGDGGLDDPPGGDPVPAPLLWDQRYTESRN